jgi:hypothetical protein
MVMRLGLMGTAVRAAGVAGPGAGAQRLIKDLLDGAGAAATFGAAAETSIDLPRRARQIVRSSDGRADIVVAEDVTGTNDHGVKSALVGDAGDTDIEGTAAMQKEKPSFQAIPNCTTEAVNRRWRHGAFLSSTAAGVGKNRSTKSLGKNAWLTVPMGPILHRSIHEPAILAILAGLRHCVH